MDPINIPQSCFMLAYIPAPWILWAIGWSLKIRMMTGVPPCFRKPPLGMHKKISNGIIFQYLQ